MIEIKKITSNNDYKTLLDLASIIWKEHYTPIFDSDQADYMLALFQSDKAIQEQLNNEVEYHGIHSSGKMIGYLAYKKNSDSLFLDKLYLISTFRGQSIGTSCLNFIEQKATEMQCNSISLKVEQNNLSSIITFERLGFKIVDSISRNIGRGFTLSGHLMTKQIS